MLISVGVLLLLLLQPLTCAGQLVLFQTKYAKTNLTGRIGHSVTFAWTFSGGVDTVSWGLANDAGTGIDRMLVSLDVLNANVLQPGSVPDAYRGRVNGTRTGGSSFGQASFILYDVTKNDERFYGCSLTADGPDGLKIFDFVQLVVVGQSVLFQTKYAKTNLTGRIGHSVTFAWTFSGGVDTITWGLANDAGTDIDRTLVSLDVLNANVLQPGSVPDAYRGRVNGTRTGGSSFGQASFILYDVTKNDERFYGCSLTADGPDGLKIFDFVQLVVVGPPNIRHVSHNQTANEGDKVILNCTADGNPPPNITWTRLSSNSHVTFPLAVRRQDEGGYRCIADNGFGIKIRDVFITVQYAATVEKVAPATSHSWIGQTVKLTCKADGSPTPTLSWKNPSGRVIKQETELKTTVNVLMKSDKDFGNYTCEATNDVNTDTSTVLVQQIKAPGSPTVTVKIEATSITVRWTKPADDGGSPITAYRVLILRGNTEIENENITDTSVKHQDIGGLNKSTNYAIKLFARNYVFEGKATERKIQTKYEGVPAAAEITDLPAETKDVKITLKWKEAENNGASIIQYTVYRRPVREDGTSLNWSKIKEITDTSDLKVVVNLEKGKEYEFVVSATNIFGEGGKEERKIRKIKVLGGVPSTVAFTYELKADEITLKWEEPNNNGAEITMYTVYYGTQSDEQWKETEKITDVSVRKYVVKVEMGQKYKVLVTASNKYGESSKEDKMQRVDVPEGSSKPTGGQTGSSCVNQKEILHAVYITIICLLLISNLILICVVCRMRTRSEKSRERKNCPRCGDLLAMNPIAVKVEADTQSFDVEQTFAAPTYASTASADYMPLHPSTRSWEISRRQVNIVKVIGKGAFSQVAKATVNGMRGSQDNLTVAVKMLKANAPASDKKDLLSEVDVMKKLKPHPHVIKLLGCVTETEPLLVLIEYVPYGDLLGFLRKSRGLNDTYFKDPDMKPQTNLTAEQLMKFAWQVADGMCYLSSKKIIHRDLAARNVLVGEGEKCKVTDFGMARDVHQEDIYNKTSRGRLPVKWTAYESLMYGTYTTQSDVWSYGVVLYEILTVGGSPYPDINARKIAQKLQEGYRMPKPKHVEIKLYQIMLDCWRENPVDRPTFERLGNTMKEMERNHKTYVNLKQYDHSLYANVNNLKAM